MSAATEATDARIGRNSQRTRRNRPTPTDASSSPTTTSAASSRSGATAQQQQQEEDGFNIFQILNWLMFFFVMQNVVSSVVHKFMPPDVNVVPTTTTTTSPPSSSSTLMNGDGIVTTNAGVRDAPRHQRGKPLGATLCGDRFQLFNCSWAVHVGANCQHFFLLLLHQVPSQLGRGGGFTSALQASH